MLPAHHQAETVEGEHGRQFGRREATYSPQQLAEIIKKRQSVDTNMENGANYVLIEGVLKTQAQQQPFHGPQLPVTKMVNHFANVWNWFVKCS